MTLATANADTPISRKSLAEEVYDRVLTDVVSGRYVPRERLNVDQIASELGVSRTPVREALTRLQWDGFVHAAPNSRTRVADWGADDMRERLEVINRLVTFIAADPRVDLARFADASRELLTAQVPDYQVYLALSESIVANGFNKIALYTTRNLVTPLRLFFSGSAAAAHGVQLSVGGDSRRALLSRALNAAAHHDPASCALLNRYAIVLTTMLPQRHPSIIS